MTIFRDKDFAFKTDWSEKDIKDCVGMLNGMATKKRVNAQCIDDLKQETLLHFIVNKESTKKLAMRYFYESLATAYDISKSKKREEKRKTHKRTFMEEASIRLKDEELAQEYDIVKADVHEGLKGLNAVEFAVIYDSFFERLGLEEIGEKLDKKIHEVKKIRNAALLKMKIRLGEYELFQVKKT